MGPDNGIEAQQRPATLDLVDHLLLAAAGIASVFIIQRRSNGERLGHVSVEKGESPAAAGIRLNAYVGEFARTHPDDVHTVGPLSVEDATVLLKQVLEPIRPSTLG